MGWARMLFFGNWGQQMDIEDHRSAISSLRRKIRKSNRAGADVNRRIEELEKENDELRLYLASLVRYLGSKGVLQKEEFSSFVEIVDTEDGEADGAFKGDIMD